MGYFAHTDRDKNGIKLKEDEPLSGHLLRTAETAEGFADKFGYGAWGYLAGIFHDIGKYQKSFQDKLAGKICDVEHSGCGAAELLALNKAAFAPNKNPLAAAILAYCVAGHHGGLPNGGADASTAEASTLAGRVKRTFEDFSAYKRDFSDAARLLSELRLNPSMVPAVPHASKEEWKRFAVRLAHLARMLYSCLVDADFIETERYFDGEKTRAVTADFKDVLLRLREKEDYFAAREPKNEKQAYLYLKRAEILKQCREKAACLKGLYSLTVPTGGGKTLSSMSFAVEHLLKHGMDRIIYVIPYTSIVEQTATTFKDIFGKDVVLEHHCNFDFGDADDEQNSFRVQRLASENWDAPIIVTTNVQFFESFYANKSSKCRKLHNVANSVIIFDEAQVLPLKFLKPCLSLIDLLVKDYGCTALLMTATQPCFSSARKLKFFGSATELIDGYEKLYQDFRRTRVEFIGKKTDEEIAGMVSREEQALLIVNTKAHAREMYLRLSACFGEDVLYHLSTNMVPEHRRAVLKTVCDRLEAGLPCVVVSTNLIECGVDVGFKSVYRSLAGIDSVIQSAGRCNRDWKAECGSVYVFKADSPFEVKQGEMLVAQGVSEQVAGKYGDDIISPEAVTAYFKTLYDIRGDETDNCMIEDNFCFYKDCTVKFEFATCAADFKLIEEKGVDVIIPYCDDAYGLIDRLKFGNCPLSVKRKLQGYTVNVYERDAQKLLSAGAIRQVGNEKTGLVFVLTTLRAGDRVFYSKAYGLDATEADKTDAFFS
ncbi:MAG: CRISPR-associated helicase Cas3' [Clostridiaceae bacterium]|jgi:CRISPR-associated endonuclease/helicase Cas3|nr:CRISPR-associated helicase Cas3' [Clostridiaceae bacterium]